MIPPAGREHPESLAEQASYIWFTRELDAELPGRLEPTPRASGRRGGGGGGGGGAPKVRRGADSYSKENGLLSLNLLLFEVCQFSPRERGDATAEHTSLAHLVRRSGGPASLFTLCALYAALARRLGVILELVSLRLPGLLKGRAPDLLLRLPGGAEQEELYVDILAGGRLRSAWDLKEYADAPLRAEDVRAAVHELTPAEFCLRLVEELAEACEAADDRAEAAFWQIELEVLQGQLRLAEERRASGRNEPGGGDVL